MTDAPAPDSTSPLDVGPPLRAAQIAAYLAARMCHDLISPASAIVSGLDLLEDPSAHDMREEAMSLISSSAHKLTDLLSFSRVAFGASASAETFDVRDLEKLAQGVFGHVRADLEWLVEPEAVEKPAARALLNLAQMAGAALPTGGIARVRAAREGNTIAIAAEASGPRARLRPEVREGLQGLPLGEGLHGHWIQAYYVHLFLRDAGGRVYADESEERVVLVATVPNASTAP